MSDRLPSVLDDLSAPTIPIGQAALIERFRAALETTSVTSHVAENAVIARLGLTVQLQDEGVSEMLAWPADQLPIGGVLEALDVLGVAVSYPNLQNPATRKQNLHAADQIDVGLVGADAAIAASGTLILASLPGRSQLVHRLPRRLIVLLPASRLFATLEDWLAHWRQQGDLSLLTRSRQLNFVTGPSRTRDIELAPAMGVHGPRRVHVVIALEI